MTIISRRLVDQKLIDFEKLSEAGEAFTGYKIQPRALCSGSNKGEVRSKGILPRGSWLRCRSSWAFPRNRVPTFLNYFCLSCEAELYVLLLASQGGGGGACKGNQVSKTFRISTISACSTMSSVFRLDLDLWLLSIRVSVLACAMIQNCFKTACSSVEIYDNKVKPMWMCKD